MSFERAGAPTHGALNRETARPVLVGLMAGAPAAYRINAALDALEACVVPDPRITRIEALHADRRLWVRDANDSLIEGVHADQLSAILRGEK
jgi:hypothetical protein